jgi:outer membrane protein TolC
MKANLGAGLFLVLLAGPALAQTPGPLTLVQALKEARTANLALWVQRLGVDLRRRDKDLAWNRLLPTVSVGGGLVRLNDTRPDDLLSFVNTADANPATANVYANYDNWNVALQVKAQFVLSWATLKAIDQTTLEYRHAELSYDEAAQRLDRDVKKVFFQLLVQQESIRVTESQLANAERRYQEALTNLNAGQDSELTVLQAKVAWENRKPVLDDLRVGYAQVLFGFENLLGRAPDPSVVLEGSLDIAAPPSDPDPAATAEAYLDRRLDVQVAESQIRTLGGEAGVQEAQLFPAFVVQWTADPTLNAPFSAGTNWGTGNWYQQTGSLGFFLDWKLDSFVPGSGFINQKADILDLEKQALFTLEQTRMAAKTEVITLFYKIRKSTAALAALAENVSSADQAYHLTETAYRSGARSLLEVQDAELQYQVAQLNLLNEKEKLNSNLLDLETALNSSREEIYGQR